MCGVDACGRGRMGSTVCTTIWGVWSCAGCIGICVGACVGVCVDVCVCWCSADAASLLVRLMGLSSMSRDIPIPGALASSSATVGFGVGCTAALDVHVEVGMPDMDGALMGASVAWRVV